MPDPQQQTTPTSVPASDGRIDLSGLRVRTLGGIDLSGLRLRTLQQSKNELPQPQITPPWEDEPRLPTAPTSKLGKAYADAKQWFSDHEQHVSEKYLAPFREGLDRLGEDLQQAGESGHTAIGGQLVGPARALLSGAGTLLKQTPVGRDIKSTALAWAMPPELGPEGKALSRELKAGEKAEQWKPHDLGKAHDLPSEQGYAYHATNEERAKEIAESGGMQTHKPWEHTDQSAWPDGSTEKRIYFTPKASSAWQFAPEEGKSVLLRVKQDAAKLKAEGTGDLYSQKPIHHKNVEILGDDKQWHRVSDLTNPEAKSKSANETDLSGLRTRVFSPAKAKPAPKPVEPVGIHEDDVPRRSNVPDVDWSEQDLQDSAKSIDEHTIAKDYGPKRKGAKFSVYKSHIPMEDLPSAKIAEEEDPEFQDSDWRENYQGLTRSTTPPIKVRVNPKGEMEILDGNHRAQLWSDADMTHAPAWVIDERGKGIENLSEDQKAERAELEEERQQEARQTKAAQKPSANAKDLPAQPRLPDTGTHAAIKTDDGGIYPDLNPEKQRTHIMLAQDLGIPPERVVSGGWLRDGEYEGSERSDAGRWGEQARAKATVAEKRTSRSQTEQTPVATETLYHGSPDVSKIDSLKPGSAGGYFGNGVYLTRDPDVARRFTNLESANPTLERNADGSFTDINTGKRVPGGQPGVLKTSLKNARLKDFTIDEMDAETEKFRKPNGVIDLDAARNAVAEKYAKQGYDGFDVRATKHFDEPQVVIFPSSAAKLSITKPLAPEGKSIFTPEGAQPLADKLGAKVVGSVVTGKTSPNAYGINRGPKDLDLRVEKYDSKQVEAAMREAGFEPSGSSVLSPAEIKASGKSFGKPGWKRAEHFENADGQRVDIWHDGSTEAAKIDLTGLRVRPVGAGRQPANWTAFVASDGKKYRYPADVTWEQIVKADPGAKKIK